MSEQDWTPRRQGPRYCSPACGGECTWADYEEAVKEASKLAARTGWTPRVWENLGWHFSVKGPVWDERRGDRFSLHVTADKSYYICNGPSDLCTGEFYDDPQTAIIEWGQHVVAARDKVQAVLDQLGIR